MLSAVVLAKDNETIPEKCRKSLAFCDEVKIIHKAGNFAEKRNFGMAEVRGEWILFIDSDEEVSEELVTEIKRIVADEKTSKIAYYIKRRDFWWGRELKWGEVLQARRKGFIRLIKKDSGRWIGAVHESFKSIGSVGQLNSFINHHPHPTISEFIADINFYSTLRADELFKQGKKTNVFKLIFFPTAKFLYTCIILLGFLDGAAGFVYSFLMSFHSFLVRSKLYIKGQDPSTSSRQT